MNYFFRLTKNVPPKKDDSPLDLPSLLNILQARSLEFLTFLEGSLKPVIGSSELCKFEAILVSSCFLHRPIDE